MATANEAEDTAAVEIRGPLQPGDGAVAALSGAEARSAARPPAETGSVSEEEGDRKLIQAAQQGALEQLPLLLAAGADVRMRDASGQTALHWAADKGHLQVARCLLEGGAEADARDGGQSTPLHVAALYGHTGLVQLLLESKADPNARNELGRTPLHFAAVFGHEESAAALLEAGADREVRDRGRQEYGSGLEERRRASGGSAVLWRTSASLVVILNPRSLRSAVPLFAPRCRQQTMHPAGAVATLAALLAANGTSVMDCVCRHIKKVHDSGRVSELSVCQLVMWWSYCDYSGDESTVYVESSFAGQAGLELWSHQEMLPPAAAAARGGVWSALPPTVQLSLVQPGVSCPYPHCQL
ncbi:ankyrin repeat domain-containing protein 65-like [Schistocerca gregaria]|uniref:ankyrin repeat domain-containing protein 65-like n=1 Tax=Schistocerca gregaria TaxID=7010 RepID=UPI00211E1EE8|nr:ankyrin repeat domain-containing protein 65-like [Schistocerca gregaria]